MKKKAKKKLRAKSHDLDREPVKPLTRTRKTLTRKTWGRGLTGTGTGWPGIPQGYLCYSLHGTHGKGRTVGRTQAKGSSQRFNDCYDAFGCRSQQFLAQL